MNNNNNNNAIALHGTFVVEESDDYIRTPLIVTRLILTSPGNKVEKNNNNNIQIPDKYLHHMKSTQNRNELHAVLAVTSSY